MATTSAPPTLDPKDVLGLDHLLGAEDIMLRDSVRRWVGDRVLPEIGNWFEEGILPREHEVEGGEHPRHRRDADVELPEDLRKRERDDRRVREREPHTEPEQPGA